MKYMNKKEQLLIMNRPKQGFGVTKELFIDHRQFVTLQLRKAAATIQSQELFGDRDVDHLLKGLTTTNAIGSFIVFGQWLESL